MIRITSSMDIVVELEGKIEELSPEKRGYIENESIYGEIKTEQTRVVPKINIVVDYLNVGNKEDLFLIYSADNSRLTVIDTETGESYSRMFIESEGLTLEKKANEKKGVYYWSGAINLRTR